MQGLVPNDAEQLKNLAVQVSAITRLVASMSKAGYPYDNVPMERYYNTIKNELVYLLEYHLEDELYKVKEGYRLSNIIVRDESCKWLYY